MKEQMAAYFSAEKTESAIFVVCGLVAIAASVWLFVSASAYKGMAIPLVLIALIQLGVGGSVYARTSPQLAALDAQLTESPPTFKSAETARMETVMRNFRIYKLVEITILALGIGLTSLLPRNPWAYSAGIGCIAQASLMLVFDLFAEHRGQAYLDAIRQL